jgi:hypothetical protein
MDWISRNAVQGKFAAATLEAGQADFQEQPRTMTMAD